VTIPRRRITRLAIFSALAAITLVVAPTWAAGKTTAARVPDLSGWWLVEMGGNRPPSGPASSSPNASAGTRAATPGANVSRSASAPDARFVFGQPPFKPEYKELARKYAAYEMGELKEKPPGTKAFKTCGQFRFSGLFIADAEAALEFLTTPGRITITDELGQLRRIYMDRKLSAELDETYAGTSVGHWEGQTLVIETAGMNRHNQFLVLAGGIPIGAGAHSVERLSLIAPDLLQVESVVTAPDALTEPYKVVTRLRRDRDHTPHEFSYCNDSDRYLDPSSGAIFFDLTPPGDLPPPPK
jgi:hypothetical protein